MDANQKGKKLRLPLDNQSFDSAARVVGDEQKSSKSTAHRKRRKNIISSKRDKQHCEMCYKRDLTINQWNNQIRGHSFTHNITQKSDDRYLAHSEFHKLRVRQFGTKKWVKIKRHQMDEWREKQEGLKVF
jgi:hypothetical protein